MAVLPFADLSPAKDQDYFTDGITEEILFALDTIEGLKVPSRTAVFALKGKDLDIQQVGERLGVSTVLEGSVRKAGERLRITAQLVQVEDGFRLWTETYDREMDDVFAVQDEIAKSIASALELTFSGVESSEELGGTAVSDAYDFYLRGVDYARRGTQEDAEYAIQMYERAIELDPDYALALAGAARLYSSRYLNFGGDAANLVKAEKASRRALEVAPGLAQAHSARASYFTVIEDFAKSDAEFEEAIRLQPNDLTGHYRYGMALFRRGEFERTAELWETASELDPDDLRPLNLLPQVYTSLGRPEGAKRAYRRQLAASERYLELNPDDLDRVLLGATALLELGERERALELAERVMASGSSDTIVLYNNACFWAKAGDTDKAFEALGQAVDAGDRDVAWWRQDSDLDSIRDDPRFEELIARMEADQ